MDVSGGSTANDAKIQLWTCNGTGAQQFTLNGAGDIVNAQSGKCPDIQSFNTADGAKLIQWTCTGSSNQKWHRG
jgi:hypothetical protein